MDDLDGQALPPVFPKQGLETVPMTDQEDPDRPVPSRLDSRSDLMAGCKITPHGV